MSQSTAGAPVEARAAMSLGISANAIYRAAAEVVASRHPGGGVVHDVGCGRGDLRQYLRGLVADYVGVDVLRYQDWGDQTRFIRVDLNDLDWPIDADVSDLTVCLETIEHLENPRALVRQLVRITRPGGLLVVSTPNQLSWLSKMTLLIKNRFNAFQDCHYPAHLTALLEIDLLRIFKENRVRDIQVRYSDHGRLPFTSFHWPSALRGRRFSDNVLISGFCPPRG